MNTQRPRTQRRLRDRQAKRDARQHSYDTDPTRRLKAQGEQLVEGILAEGAATSVDYPDGISVLEGDGKHRQHVVVSFVLRGQGQIHKFYEAGLLEIKPLKARADAATDAAADQKECRARLKSTAKRADERAEKISEVLGPFVQHRGRAEHLRYWATIVLIVFGDVAMGVLALTAGGEDPTSAAEMMVAIGATAVTLGLMGADLKRRRIGLDAADTAEDPEDAAVIKSVFGSCDAGWGVTRRMTYGAIGAGVSIALASFVYRDASGEGAGQALAFLFWGLGICSASWYSSWVHVDPARTAIDEANATATTAAETYSRSPKDAIETREGNLAMIQVILDIAQQAGRAAWTECLAAAALAMHANPALAGHFYRGEHWLLGLEPPVIDLGFTGHGPPPPPGGGPIEDEDDDDGHGRGRHGLGIVPTPHNGTSGGGASARVEPPDLTEEGLLGWL